MQDDAKLQNTCARASGPHRPRKGHVGCKYCRTSAKITKSKLQCKMMQNCRTHVRARQARIGHDKARWVVSTLALLLVPRLLQLRSCHQEQSWETGTKSQLRSKMLQDVLTEHMCKKVSTVALLAVPRSSKANFNARWCKIAEHMCERVRPAQATTRPGGL